MHRITDYLATQTMVLISTVLLILTTISILYLSYQNVSKDINFAVKEKHGISLLMAVFPIIVSVEKLKIHLIQKKFPSDEEEYLIQEYTETISKYMEHLNNAYNSNGIAIGFTDLELEISNKKYLTFSSLSEEWEHLKNTIIKNPAGDHKSDLNLFTSDLEEIIRHIGNTSNLILDPDLDSYYLMDAILITLPKTVSELSRVSTAIYSELKAGDSIDLNEKIELAVISSAIKEFAINRIIFDIKTSINSNAETGHTTIYYKEELLPFLYKHIGAAVNLNNIINKTIKGETVASKNLLRALNDVQKESYSLWLQSISKLNGLLDVRISLHRQRLLLELAAASIGTAIAGCFIIILLLDLAQSNKKMEKHIEKIEVLEKLNEQHMDKLNRSNLDLKDFAHLVAHDLKEPLRGMGIMASLMLEDYQNKMDEDGISKLRRIVDLGKRIDHMISDLLHYSLLERIDLAMQEVDINDVITEVQQMMENTIHDRNAHILVAKQMPSVVCDRPRTTELFRNLIMNALKYNDKKEAIIEIGFLDSMNSPQGHKKNVFFVKDNGIGIDKKFHDQVFSLFKRRASGIDGGEDMGTGAGLTFVKKIIERHNGCIWLESEMGKGTTFYFTLVGSASSQ